MQGERRAAPSGGGRRGEAGDYMPLGDVMVRVAQKNDRLDAQAAENVIPLNGGPVPCSPPIAVCITKPYAVPSS